MAGEAFRFDQLVEQIEEEWVVNGKRKLNMPHMSQTIDRFESACHTRLMLLDRSHRRIVETTRDRLIQVVIDLRLRHTFNTEFENLIRLEERQSQAPRTSESVSHHNQISAFSCCAAEYCSLTWYHPNASDLTDSCRISLGGGPATLMATSASAAR